MSDDHGSFDELADLDEGLLEPSRADEVRAHLAGCTECRARHQALRDVHDELAVLPPERMPVGVAERIDRAVAEAAVPRSATVTPLLPRQRRRPALAGVAAAIVLVGAVAAIVVGSLLHNPSSSSGTSASSAVVAQGAGPAQASHFTTTVTSRTFDHDNATAGIVALTSKPVPHGNSPATTNSVPPVPKQLKTLFGSRSKLLSCAADVGPVQGAVPQAVVFGRYTKANLKNAPSVFFVFPTGPNRADIVVVGPSCSGLDQIRDDFFGVPLG